MRIAKGLLIGVVAAAISVACLWTACCEDKPTEPKPAKDYPVYIGDLAGPSIFTYYPRSRRVDSAAIPWEANWGISASADGKRLYLATDSNVVVIDPATRGVLTELPYRRSWSVVVSPDNRLVAITGDDLFILRTSDYSVLFSDTDMTEEGRFSSDSKTFYCAAGWSTTSTGFVYKVKLACGQSLVERLHIPQGGVLYVVPSNDETKLFLYVRYRTWTCGFEVYDVAADSIIFRDILVPGAGEIAMTSDGKYVFYTNPGVSVTDPPPPGTFTIFDVVKNQIHDTVSAYDYVPPTWCTCPPNTMAVTPDDRWLVMLGGAGLGQFVMYLYDLRKEEFVDYQELGGGVFLTNPTTQMMR
ncbi:MAG: hypothetical protein NTW07_03240 [candidate division Zixibacteria bacterium]|nr:hypothetical protein [candidate division Zixibacteria bacterium]